MLVRIPRPVVGLALISAIALAAAVALTTRPVADAAGTPAVSRPAAGTITVLGRGQVAASPLQASFDAGVQVEAPTAAAALAADDVAMHRVLAALAAQGIPTVDLQTENLSVSPQYRGSSSNPGPGTISDFVADDTVAVTVVDPARVGMAIDAALHAGANDLGDVSFAPLHPAQLQRQALMAALANARSQAEALAQAAGITLGPAVNISTQVQGPEPIFGAMAVPAAASSTPVLSGSQRVSAEVTVTFATTA